jgi:protease secretion system outer membrane protein
MTRLPASLRRFALIGLALCGGWRVAHAGEFEKAYLAALENDARFQAARAALASGQQAVPLARSGVLPTVSASITETTVQGTQQYDVAGSASKTNNLDYRAPVQSINLRAPLLNLEGTARVRQATAQAGNAEATFVSRKAELVDRLAVAYLQRMLAEDAFLSLHAQVHATVAQRNLMRRRFEQGEGTRTEVAEARANLSLTLVQWADSKNQMMTARETLEAMTGLPQPLVVRLEDEFAPPALVPASLQEWQDKAVAANPDIQARRYLVDAADAQVARSNAGHMPRLDLVASVSNSRNESVSSLNQSVNQSAIGLQLNIPIYSGGAVKAAVTQALAEKSKAEAEWLNEKRSLEVEVSRLFQIIQSGKSKLLAYEDVLDASRVALEGTLKGQTSGLRTNADVLEAVRKVFQAQRDLAQARYDHIFQRLRLYNKAGVPADSVVSYIDELLSPARTTP